VSDTNTERLAQTIRGAFWHGQNLGGHNNYRAAKETLAELLALAQEAGRLRGALNEIHEYHCGCDRPGHPHACIATPIEEFAVLGRPAGEA
jgi:hypothetical protein